MTTVSEIRSRDWSPRVGEYGSIVENIADIDQCLRIICATPKGTVPLRRDFGSDLWKWLDKPFAVAQANIPLAILEAMRWEPRVEVLRITVRQHDEIHRLYIGIEWRVRESDTGSSLLFISSSELQPTSSDSQNAAPVRVVIAQPAKPNDYEPVTLPNEIPDIVALYEQARTT
jgi:uncharacterized protein